ncbi:hypothetical protein QQ045_003034 [Rhodiola kirilowii]
MSKGKGLYTDGNEGFVDSPKVSTFFEEPAWSRSPLKTTSSKKKKMSKFDKAFQLVKMIEIKCHEDSLYEAMANMEEVKFRGDEFIAKCIRFLIKESLDKQMFVKLKNDA